MAELSNIVTPERIRALLSTFISDGNQLEIGNGKCADVEDGTSAIKETQHDDTAKIGYSNLRGREAFFARVDTYSPLTWFAKPKELSPLICSQIGWENVETDMLQCVSCKMRLCGALPSNTNQAIYKDACRKLETSLTDNHEKTCTWPTNPAPDSFFQVPYFNPDEVRKDFQQRYCLFKSIASTLPEINYDTITQYGLDKHCSKKLAYVLDKSSKDDLKTAATLAVLGWTVSVKDNTLICTHCRRKVGLWNLKMNEGNSKPNEVNEKNTQEEGEDRPNKKQKLEANTFDPSNEHRTFCPWIKLKVDVSPRKVLSHDESSDLDTSDLNTSTATSQTPGWVDNLKLIAPNLLVNLSNSFSQMIKKSSTMVGLRSIRRLFEQTAENL